MKVEIRNARTILFFVSFVFVTNDSSYAPSHLSRP